MRTRFLSRRGRMRTTEGSTATPKQTPNLVDEARTAIWRLFQEGYVDEDMATAGLLAVDLGTRRAQRHGSTTTMGDHHDGNLPREDY